MNSSDVRIVRLIPTTTDGSFSRASDATFYDAAGVLQTAPPNTLRVTYDPSDLSKAPYAVIEPAATNLQPYSSNLANPSGWNRANADVVDNVTIGPDGAVTADSWTVAANGASTIAGLIVSVPVGATISVSRFIKKAVGADWIFLGVQGPSFLNEAGVFLNIVTGEVGASQVLAGTQVAYRSGSAKAESIGNGWFRVSASFDTTVTTSVVNILRAARSDGAIGSPLAGDAYFLWGAQTEVGLATTSYFPTTNAAGMRAADAVGAGAGLLYSNVAITEPLWVAGTYALGAKVRDAQNFVFESLVAGNTAPLTDTTKTKWLPLGITNRWKAFDKAVNSQTSAPGRLTFSVKPGAVATTMMLLNMEGALVTVSQTESGYVQTKSLVSHEVDNWYDFYYEEPVRAGDAVFTDIPPFPNAMLTVSIDNGPLESKIGACLIGKPMVIGKATASFKAGVLSYSTSTADTFGNITMVKRYNAPRMNFDVMIPAGSESVIFRILREYTDTEIGIIVGDTLSMGIGYGYLGQWDVPKSGSGRTAPIEFKGLV